MQIVTLDAESESKVFGLVAGPAGIGKTTQATTFPKKETLILSLEKGLLSIKGSGYAAIEINSYDEVMEAIDNIKKIAPWCKYLFIDSLAEIYDLITKDAKDKFTPAQAFPMRDYIRMRLFHCIRSAKNLDISCFFVCHTKMEKNGLDLTEELSFEGKLPQDIKKQFDLILHMTNYETEEGETHRVFKTSPEVSTVAKRRVSPWLNIEIKDIEEPNLYELTKKLLGKGE